MSPDEMQLQASDPNYSVWVSASAGSGKTTVLTNRVLRLLLEGNAPGKIVCITYTKIAAAEMLARISKRLSRWMVCAEQELIADLTALCGEPPNQDYLRKARLLFLQLQEAEPGLQVQTIHSFCQSVLERFPLEASVTPGFTVLDDAMQKEILRECKSELYARIISEDDKLLLAASESLSYWGEIGTEKILDSIISERTLLERWLLQTDKHSLSELLQKIQNQDYDIAQCKSKLHSYIEQNRDAIDALCECLKAGTETDIKRGECVSYFLSNLNDNFAFDAVCKSLLDDKEFKPKSKLITKKLCENNPSSEIALNLLAENISVCLDELRTARAVIDSAVVSIIAHAFLTLYRQYKRERSLLDYDDLIQESLRLLSNEHVVPWVLFKLDDAINHLLLDEAQDTSPQQWHLVRIIIREIILSAGDGTRCRSFFIVGDKKQSIYSFQGADPHEYVAMQQELEELCKLYHYPFIVVPMNISFRSAPAVLNAVDVALSGDETLRGVLSDKKLHHIPFRDKAIGLVEMWPAAHSQKVKFPEWQLPDHMALPERGDAVLAQRITASIQHWLDTGRVLASSGHRIEPQDILILVRRRSGLMPILTRLLKDRGIPVSGIDRLILSDHLAVQDMLSLAAFLLNPEDDLSLCEILKSPLFGLDDAALIRICAGRGALSVWQRLQAEGDFKQVALRLQDWLAKADYYTPYQLFSHVLYLCDGKKSYDARMGNEAVEVLGIFLSTVLEYEDLHPAEASLQHLLEWMRGSRLEVKREMEEAGNVVRIMTVHGAKGLEAPIVILPDTSGLPNFKHIMFHVDDKGKLWFLRSLKNCPSFLRPACKKQRELAMQEYYRLLYVAMTRAKDELYIAGVKPSQQKIPEDSWYETIRTAFAGDAGTVELKWHEAYPMLPFEMEEDAILFQRSNSGEIMIAGYKEQPTAVREDRLPGFFAEPPSIEAVPVFQNPSRLYRTPPAGPSAGLNSETIRKAADRGNLIHRILELMPVEHASMRQRFVNHYLEAYVPQWSAESRKQVVEEIMELLRQPEISLLFGAQGMTEVPVVGALPDGKRFSAQIDRLYIGEREILLVDFKTGVVPEKKDIPQAYRVQMETYSNLMRPIYPDKTVKCMLVYTAGPTIFELENTV